MQWQGNENEKCRRLGGISSFLQRFCVGGSVRMASCVVDVMSGS
jgi:hypothetical protein